MRIMNGFDNCPYCSRQILYNAMRCQHCGKTLRTPEETLTMIDRMKLIDERNRKTARIRKVVTYALIAVIGLAWWSGALHSVVRF